MNRPLVFVASGFVAGAVSMLLILVLMGRLGSSQGTLEEDERERLLGRISHLEAQQNRGPESGSRSLLGRSSRRNEESGLVSVQEGSGDAGKGSAVQDGEMVDSRPFDELRQQHHKATVDRLLNSLASSLDLSEEEWERVGEFLDRELTPPAFGHGPVLMTPPGVREDEALAKLRETLPPGQQAALDAVLEARLENRIEANAHSELAALQSQFLLTDEQKAAAFEVFSDMARDRELVKDSGWDVESMRQHQAEKAEALADVLTPEQMEMYQAGGNAIQIFSSGGDVLSGPAAIRFEAVLPAAEVAPREPTVK